jgi:hypothetical protein
MVGHPEVEPERLGFGTAADNQELFAERFHATAAFTPGRGLDHYSSILRNPQCNP